MNAYSTKPVVTDDTVHAFESDLAKADAVRASALSRLQQLRAAKVNHDEREKKRLTAKFGEGHPDVVKLEAEVAADQRFGAELGAEINRATTVAPVVDEKGWALHGFVRDQNLQGQPNLTVALFNSANRWIEALGHACTDATGYFQLCYSSDGNPAAGQWREIFIRVLSRKQEVLYRDKKPMSVVLGKVKYREIILNGDTATCQPPSDTPAKDSPSITTPSIPAPKSRKARVAKSSASISKARKSRSTKKATRGKKS